MAESVTDLLERMTLPLCVAAAILVGLYALLELREGVGWLLGIGSTALIVVGLAKSERRIRTDEVARARARIQQSRQQRRRVGRATGTMMAKLQSGPVEVTVGGQRYVYLLGADHALEVSDGAGGMRRITEPRLLGRIKEAAVRERGRDASPE